MIQAAQRVQRGWKTGAWQENWILNGAEMVLVS